MSKNRQTKAKTGAKQVTRTALEAWQHFRASGGLDLRTRDHELEAQLRARLDVEAPTLDHALRTCTTDQLIRAFFAIAAPFAEMFRDIVAFFKQAGADEGPDQWVIKIDEDHIDLRAFQKFLETWETVEGELVVPAVDRNGLHIPTFVAKGQPWWSEPRSRAQTGIADVDAWLARYYDGEYAPYPESLLPGRVPGPLADAAAVTWMAVSILAETGSTREGLSHIRSVVFGGHDDGIRIIETDGLALGTLVAIDHDYLLGPIIASLASLAHQPVAHLNAIAQPLADAYARFSRRTMRFRADAKALEKVLSLPVWRQRHELYAVWIAVEAVRNLKDHKVELHHEDGRITFAFKKTVIATVKTTRPEKRLIAEYRTPLDNPSGHGRVGGVQPDYGIWIGDGETETCGLVIEVKHYLKPANARFREVLNDYARAHPKAQIVLVNHGPANDMTEGVDSGVRSRCRVIGDLTTTNLTGRANLKKLIRDCVGDPVPEGPATGATVCVIDISGSMQDYLTVDILSDFLMQPTAKLSNYVYLVDDRIRSEMALSAALAQLPFAPGAGTALTEPVRLLRSTYTVFLLTDSDGLEELKKAGIPLTLAILIRPGLWHITIPIASP